MTRKAMETGEAAIRLTRAVALDGEFPDDVPDTPANQVLFTKIKADVAAMPDGVSPDVPYDYNMDTKRVRS
jgi:hypothetical protein